jgi:hypothetical protein
MSERCSERYQQGRSNAYHDETMRLATTRAPYAALVSGIPASWPSSYLVAALTSQIGKERIHVVRCDAYTGGGFLVEPGDATDLANLLALNGCRIRDVTLQIRPWVSELAEACALGEERSSSQTLMQPSQIQWERERPSKRTRLSDNSDVRSSSLDLSINELKMRKECHVALLTMPQDISLEELENYINTAMRKKGIHASDPVVASIPLSRFTCRFICTSPVAAQNIVRHLTGAFLNGRELAFCLVREIKMPAERTLIDQTGTVNGFPNHSEGSLSTGDNSELGNDYYSRLVLWNNPPTGLERNEAKSSLNRMVFDYGLFDHEVILQVVATTRGFSFTAESEDAAIKILSLSGKKLLGTTLHLGRHSRYFAAISVFASIFTQSDHPRATNRDLVDFICEKMRDSGLPHEKPVIFCHQKGTSMWTIVMASPEHAKKCCALDGVRFKGCRLRLQRHRSYKEQALVQNIEKRFVGRQSQSLSSRQTQPPIDPSESDALVEGRCMNFEYNSAGDSGVEAWTKEECTKNPLSSSCVVRITDPMKGVEVVAGKQSDQLIEGRLSADMTVVLRNENAKLKEANDTLRRDLVRIVKMNKVDHKAYKAMGEHNSESSHLQRELALVIEERDSEIRESQVYQEEIFNAKYQHNTNLEEIIKKLKDDLELLKRQNATEIALNQKQQADHLKLRYQYDTEMEEKATLQRQYEAVVEENKNLQRDLASTKEKLHVVHRDWQELVLKLTDANSMHESEHQQAGRELDQLRHVLNETIQAKDELVKLYNAERLHEQRSKATAHEEALVKRKNEEPFDF